ncbi:DUF262 domain-containing protein [Terracoccus luteus]|uniref:DUF262 domain-containing protein n=1 Tax=Terracoccus luteus TaxID=53356 RepID=A0A839PZE2_9MICO|nr:DUF262 domain-containing protein [Terracoccus luteus]MBB2988533.1 hypothetical protein [Terracoccus luteus]MCP2174182.1 hypothetical protein [Terracoccus luteus]
MSSEAASSATQLRVDVWKVGDLLREQSLRIPDYQRPYRWEVRNVAQLIDDVHEFMHLGAYRLGSIILHEDESEDLNIVDGQQRFITLVLIAHALASAGSTQIDPVAIQEHKVSEFGLDVTRERLTENFAYIRETISRWTPADRERFAAFVLQSCEVLVLILSNVDEAFQMFDSQNTRGKALDPTDLLKAYHIREMDSDAVSEDTKRRMVAIWEDVRPAEVSSLFADHLFKIKRWSSGRDVPDSGLRTADVDVFKGVREKDPHNYHNHWARPLLYAKNFTEDFRLENAALVRFGILKPVDYPYQIDQPIINGETFFTSVRYYHQLATTYGLFGPKSRRGDLPREIDVLDAHRNDTRYGLTRNLFDNLLLYYVDRFGEQDLESAVRLFARHAVSLRARHYAVKRSMINRYALTEPNLFREIRDSIRPREVLRRTVARPELSSTVRPFGDFDAIVPAIWGPEDAN